MRKQKCIIKSILSIKLERELITDGDKPKGRPFGFHMLDRDRLYFGCGTFKNVFSQLTKNPHVEVMAVNGRDGFKDSRDDVFSNTVAACYFRSGK